MKAEYLLFSRRRADFFSGGYDLIASGHECTSDVGCIFVGDTVSFSSLNGLHLRLNRTT